MTTQPGGRARDLAVVAIEAALSDAGLRREEVDGLLVASSQGIRPDRVSVELARQAGLGDLRLLEHLEIKGATTVAMVAHAALAVRAGLARRVLCVFADAPLRPGGSAGASYDNSGGVSGVRGLERASGVLGSVPTYALLASRYLAASGGTEEDLCAVAVSARAWAVGNPDAVSRTPLDCAGYHASRMVAEPLRVLDCARPVNGAAAVVVAGHPTAGVQPPAYVLGLGQSHPRRRRHGPGESWFGGGRVAVETALRSAGIARSGLDIVELYDPFSAVTLCLLDEYGLVPDGGPVGEFVRGGGIAPGGTLPVNTGGGQLAGFYLQGMTPLVEALTQLRGSAGARQVDGASTALVTGLGGRLDHHACLVLGREAGS
ncbi:MAG TPA: thiolase family protein [Mycobacteriales bacterium]|jgi:acetyl-CoA acetyltransferase|nr:thiolase family protein [Mycobacteriales bacterium]